jgi:hypothetical protein
MDRVEQVVKHNCDNSECGYPANRQFNYQCHYGLSQIACIVDDHPKPAAASLLPMPRAAPVAIVVVSITLTPVQKVGE